MLFALGIEEVGYVTGRNLAQQFRTIDALLAATPEQIEETPGVGPKMALTIHEQLADPQMRELIEDLQGAGAEVRGGGPAPGRGPARRQDARADRDAADADARAGDRDDHRGGRQGHRLGVAQDRLRGRRREPGSKLAQAERLGVPVIDEDGLRALLA